MQKKSIKIFVNLLESIMQESSSALDLVRKLPNADVLIPHMHRQLGLPHDQWYDEVKKLSWSEIKAKNRYGSRDNLNWVLVKGENGVGAIAARDDYIALAVYDGDVVEKRDDRGGNILDWLKAYIGKIQGFYVGKDSGEVRKKKTDRASQKPVPTEGYTSLENFISMLLKKFKPLWVRSLELAQADIKGFLGTQLKNNAYDKADKKLNRLKNIEQMLRAMDDGADPTKSGDSFDLMKVALHNAVLLTAHHYYPEKTNGFQDRARSYGRSTRHALNDQSAVKDLFYDIRGGDTAKLGTLLGFFKKGLVSG